MPDSPDSLSVPVRTADGTVTISWQARDELVERLRRRGVEGAPLAELEDASAGTPAQLEGDDARVVLETLVEWLAEPGDTDFPRGVFDLRNLLIEGAHPLP